MPTDPYAHHWSNWMKQRLDEMDATSTSIEIRLATLKADAKKQAEKAVADIQAQRAAFQEAIRKQHHESEADWAKTKSALEANWASFETAVQGYLKHARPLVEQQQATFKARAEAQRKAWEETISKLRGKAATFAAAKKQELDVELCRLQGEADAAKCKLETNLKAGEQSWAALKTALEESRIAFDKASHKALEAFKKAA